MHPPEPRPAAVVVLLRADGKVFLVERPRTSRFFPGHHAFPGGALEPADGPPGALATYAAAAARELEEEVRVRVPVAGLRPAGVTVTPPFSDVRYRSQFFVAALPRGQEARPQARELAGGAWFSPREALDGWRAGALKLPPPVIHVLEVLDVHGPEGLLSKGTSESRFPITFAKALRVEPLFVRTLPPHSHTNAFIVGERELAVVDPGASGRELAPLVEALDEDVRAGRRLRAVALTHHHHDHVGGVAELQERFGCELACSTETARRLGRKPDVALDDGATLPLAATELRAIATPGHAPGHTAFHVPASRTILPGDLVAGIGTILVAPPEGDMAAYFASLARLAGIADAAGARLLFPAHGPPSFDPARTLRATLEHRRMREGRVLDAVRFGAASVDAIAERAYADTPQAPAALARLSTEAHLVKLEREEKVVREGSNWRG